MKKMTKWIALLMAGLLLFASLIACESAYTGSDDDDDEDDEKSESSSKYKNLSPEEVLEALLETDKFTVTYEETYVNGDTDSRTVITIMKNGNKMSFNEKAQGDDQRYEINQYADIEKSLVYLKEYDGADWSVQSTEIDLEDLLEDNGISSPWLEDEAYGEYDDQNNRYPINLVFMEDQFPDLEDVTMDGYRTVKGSTYTFYVSVSDGEFTKTLTITVKFTADKITLPEVNLPNTEESGDSPIPDMQEQD